MQRVINNIEIVSDRAVNSCTGLTPKSSPRYTQLDLPNNTQKGGRQILLNLQILKLICANNSAG
jgi:hypothetical protein